MKPLKGYDFVLFFATAFFVVLGAHVVSFGIPDTPRVFSIVLGLVMYLAGIFFSLWLVVTLNHMLFVWHSRELQPWGVVVFDMLMALSLAAMAIGGYLIYNAAGWQHNFGIFLCMPGAVLFLCLLLWLGYAREYRALKKTFGDC